MEKSHVVWNKYNPDNPWVKGMVVHHKDKNHDNNNIDNLELMSKKEHVNFHKAGVPWTEESKLKDRISHLGKKASDETKQKMSTLKKGKYEGPNTPFWGKKHSEETKKKFSLQRIGNKFSVGRVAPNKGIPHTEETKNKMKIAQIKRWEKIQKKGR